MGFYCMNRRAKMDPSRCNSLEFTRISDRYRSAGRVEIIGFNCRLCNLISLALMGFFVPLTHDKLRSAVDESKEISRWKHFCIVTSSMDTSMCIRILRISLSFKLTRKRESGIVGIQAVNVNIATINKALLAFLTTSFKGRLKVFAFRLPTAIERPSTDRDSGSSDGNGVVLLSGFALSTPSRRFARLPLPLHANN
ncbi:LOW QUALITY PROTEIN: hypothetical protein V1477_010108 [Vespula maculifrons]|uniref:Uncharacterized protein n=1 Tax=Vespula maculifrons TaxID=7453 RepID=A0ABD2CBN7_VESMC